MSPAAPKPRHFRIRLVDGTDLGTMTEERAVELIRQGVIERGDRVQRVGSASWRRADEVAAHGGTGGILDSFKLCANNGAS